MKNEMNDQRTVQRGFSLKKVLEALKTRLRSLLHRLWRLIVKEVKAEAAEQLSDRLSDKAAWEAAEELMKLYRGWLGYLLSRLGEGEVRVPVLDVSRALDELSCTTVREGDEYVIRLQRNSGEVTADVSTPADQ